MPILIMFALPSKGPWSGPSLDYELMSLFESFPVVGRWSVMSNALTASAPDPSGNQAAVGYKVNHGELLHQPEWVVPDR